MVQECLVQPSGDFDISQADVLRAQWYALLEAQRPARFVVDLAAVDFLDSSGLNVLVGVAKRQRNHGGTLAVINASWQAQRLMRLTEIDTIADVGGRDAASSPSG